MDLRCISCFCSKQINVQALHASLIHPPRSKSQSWHSTCKERAFAGTCHRSVSPCSWMQSLCFTRMWELDGELHRLFQGANSTVCVGNSHTRSSVQVFAWDEWQSHTSCVSEAQKYQARETDRFFDPQSPVMLVSVLCRNCSGVGTV